MKSLNAQQHLFADTTKQIEVIEANQFISFQEKLETFGLYPLHPLGVEIFQINIGKMCNQTCKHCHVDAGPDRKEMMSEEIMQQCLQAIEKSGATTVDITGGAPEMHPKFRWFVEQISPMGKKIIVRCNLTIIVANPKFYDLPEFFKKHQIEVVSSLPYFTSKKTDSQRGEGVFEGSIKALRMLNAVGYGMPDTDLKLNLVYNPAGAFLPASQQALEQEFKNKLLTMYDIRFNHLYTITNMPVSRFLDYLVKSGNYEGYMEKLINSFNPAAAANVMCRNTISVSWDGYIYDCDFNQMLNLPVQVATSQHISKFNVEELNNREIVVKKHCFGCTAGSGSSCGGSLA